MRHRLVQARKFVRLISDSRFRSGLRYGVGASVEHYSLMSRLSISTLVDVGANVGQFTLLVTGLDPSVRVHAFEPLESPAAVFRKAFAGNERVTLHQFAIGPDDLQVGMNVSRRNDSSSLLEISSLQTQTFPGTEKVGTELVQVRRLEQLVTADDLTTPAFLKIDVQGYELDALRGCESMLGLFDFIYIEVSFLELYTGQALADEVIAFLHSHGLALTGVHNVQTAGDGKLIQCDCLFTRAKGRIR